MIAFDILLADLTDFTRRLHVSPRGLALILSPMLQFIALPRDKSLETPEARAAALESEDETLGIPLLRDGRTAWEARLKHGEAELGYFQFESGGETWWAGALATHLGDGQAFRTIVLVPEEDLAADILARRWQIAVAAAVAFVLAVLLAIWLSRRYGKPLREIAEQSARISSFELEQPVSCTDSRLEEVRTLARAQERMRGALQSFSKYVPVDIVRELTERGEAAQVGGRHETLTIFFSDIRGFTGIMERCDPDQLAAQLSEYFEAMVGILKDEGATIDKFVGDAIVAFWNAPHPRSNHAKSGVAAALRCRDDLSARNQRWKAEGKPALRTCFGLATGAVIVGNFGAPQRLSYTVLGDTVNVAARLETTNRAYGTDILVSEAVRHAAEDAYHWREIGIVSVKGRTQPIDMYEPLGRHGEVDAATLAWARQYEAALAGHRSGNSGRTAMLLDELDEQRPGDLSVRALRDACGM